MYVDTFTCTVNYNYTYKYLLVSRCVSADIQSNFSCILEKKKVYAGCSGSMSWKEYFMSAWKTTSCVHDTDMIRFNILRTARSTSTSAPDKTLKVYDIGEIIISQHQMCFMRIKMCYHICLAA